MYLNQCAKCALAEGLLVERIKVIRDYDIPNVGGVEREHCRREMGMLNCVLVELREVCKIVHAPDIDNGPIDLT